LTSCLNIATTFIGNVGTTVTMPLALLFADAPLTIFEANKIAGYILYVLFTD